MKDIYSFFKYNRKASVFHKFRIDEKLSLSDYLFLIKNDITQEIPKSIIFSLPGLFGSFCRSKYFHSFSKGMGKNCIIGKNLTFTGIENINVGSFTWIDDYVNLSSAFGEIEIGSYIHISPYSILSGGGGLYIEDYVGIASFAQVYSHSETIKAGRRMSGPMIPEDMKAFRSAPVILRKDSFVGCGAVILPGVTLAEGSVIAANSVVSKSTDPWCVYSGNPAKKVCKRRKV